MAEAVEVAWAPASEEEDSGSAEPSPDPEPTAWSPPSCCSISSPLTRTSTASFDCCDVMEPIFNYVQTDEHFMPVSGDSSSPTFVHEDSPLSYPEESIPESTPVASKVKWVTKRVTKTKSANYSNIEEIILCKAYVNASKDPIVGADQSGDDFYGKVHFLFHEEAKRQKLASNANDRTPEKLRNKFLTIQTAVNKYSGIMSHIKARPPSGTNPADDIKAADEMFQQTDKNGKRFTLHHCWDILKDEPKWSDTLVQAHVSKKLRLSGDGEDDGKSLHHPVGRDKAKAKRSAAKVRAADQLRAQLEWTIMTKSLDGMDDQQKEYVRLLRQEILEKRRAAGSSGQ